MAKKAKLFLVEDHLNTAQALKMYLETQGYVVTVAGDVASALKMAADSRFDLLICDLSLPDGTGWDLMKTLSRTAPVRAIAFTASGSAEDIAKSKRVGFLRHVLKGSAAEELAAVIEEVLKLKLKSSGSRLTKKRTAAKELS
jgi:DNA-binding response OmpR family regulator